jgi:hypothetical protein
MRLLAAISLALAACAGATESLPDLAPPPAPLTRATLAGPLCAGERCRCKQPGDDAGAPASTNIKRYEIRVGPMDNEAWVMVDDMVLYKTNERATECFYVDLYAGDHTVALRARREPFIEARLSISELAPGGPWWYSTFEFGCGGPGACDFEQLESFRESLDRYTRGIHDPCGSTKIRGIRWQSGRAPDRRHPTDLRLDLTLQVHQFVPERPSGHPECKDNY